MKKFTPHHWVIRKGDKILFKSNNLRIVITKAKEYPDNGEYIISPRM